MRMSKTVSSIFLQLAVLVLPMLGITVGSEALTTTVQTIVLIVTGLFIWFDRVQRGDVSWFGGRK